MSKFFACIFLERNGAFIELELWAVLFYVEFICVFLVFIQQTKKGLGKQQLKAEWFSKIVGMVKNAAVLRS